MPSVEEMINDLMDEVGIEAITGNTADFIRSLNEWFEEHQSLTQKQEKVLTEIYNRVFS